MRQFPSAFPTHCIIPVTDSSHGGGGSGWISSCALKQHRSGDTSQRGRIARFDWIAKHNAGTGGAHTLCSPTVTLSDQLCFVLRYRLYPLPPSLHPLSRAEQLSLSLPLAFHILCHGGICLFRPPAPRPSHFSTSNPFPRPPTLQPWSADHRR